jgi:hypothetical protein
VLAEGLAYAFEAVAATGVGLGYGCVALWLGGVVGQWLGSGAALDAGDFCVGDLGFGQCLGFLAQVLGKGGIA